MTSIHIFLMLLLALSVPSHIFAFTSLNENLNHKSRASTFTSTRPRRIIQARGSPLHPQSNENLHYRYDYKLHAHKNSTLQYEDQIASKQDRNGSSAAVLLREPLPADLPPVLNGKSTTSTNTIASASEDKYLNSLFVINKHGRNNTKTSNGDQQSLFDAQSLLEVHDNLNVLNEQAMEDLADTQIGAQGSPLDTLKEVANTKANTIGSSTKKKTYNQNPKDSQEILRTIHLRNFHKEFEQVKLWETAKHQEETAIMSTILQHQPRLYQPVLLSTLYAAFVAIKASKWIQPAPWTIAQQVTLQAPVLLQSLTTSTLIALTIPLAAHWMARFFISTYQAYQRQQTKHQILLQTKALTRSLYQSLDEVITTTPSTSGANGAWLPRPHPMLVSRSNGSKGSMNRSKDASHQVEEILTAAKCLALLGYHTHGDVDSRLFATEKLLNEEDAETVLRQGVPPTDALLERLRQVTCHLKCRDLISQYSWEERIFALEGLLDSLQRMKSSNSKTNNVGPLALQLRSPGARNIKRRLRRRTRQLKWQVTRQAQKIRPWMLWTAVFPFCLVCRQIHPVAVIWATAACAMIRVLGEATITKVQQDDPRSLFAHIMENEDVAPWERQILDTVQQQMVGPTTPPPPQPVPDDTATKEAAPTENNGVVAP